MRWHRLTRRQVLLILLAGAGLLLLWRAAPGRPIEAQVVDAQTGQPVAGAAVVGAWTKKEGWIVGVPVGGFLGVRETETDAQGRFTLRRPWALWMEEDSVTVYKYGYLAWNSAFLLPTLKRRNPPGVPPRVELDRFPAGLSHKKHLDSIDIVRFSDLYSRTSAPRFEAALRTERELP